MKKIAFSIWMNIPGSKPLPEYISISEKTNSLLEKEGYEIALFTDPIPNNEISDLLYNSPNKQIVHKCVNFSDWLRLYKIVELLESGYDEVMYKDLDIIMFEVPKNYGMMRECFLQQDEINSPINKVWLRGCNGLLRMNQSHLEIIKEHLKEVENHIRKKKGFLNHCYPFDYHYKIENEIGYLKNHQMIGSFAQPLFTTLDKAKDAVKLSGFLYGEKLKFHSSNITGYLLKDFRAEVEKAEELRDYFESYNWDNVQDDVFALFRKFSDKLRIRPNYNSDRSILKNMIKNYGYMFKNEPYIIQ